MNMVRAFAYQYRGALRVILGVLESCFVLFRQQKIITTMRGVVYRKNAKSIEMDITYRCNLKCVNCNRSCGVAPTTDEMTIAQVEKFVDESIRTHAQWDRIRLLGGEPTLHPDLFPILDIIADYKTKHSPEAIIELCTNGSNSFIKNVLSKLPKGIMVSNAFKDSPAYDGYAYYCGPKGLTRVNFHDAPKDHFWMARFDYSNGCWLPQTWGIGLSPYGYYCCSTASAIDRVFGFNLGRKQLPSKDDLLLDQRRVFCRLCGHFGQDKGSRSIAEIRASRTWVGALAQYFKTKPVLSRY